MNINKSNARYSAPNFQALKIERNDETFKLIQSLSNNNSKYASKTHVSAGFDRTRDPIYVITSFVDDILRPSFEEKLNRRFLGDKAKIITEQEAGVILNKLG